MLNRRGFLRSLFGSLAPTALNRNGASAVQSNAPSPVPPVSWSCPMHAEVIDNEPGKCPICGMALTPVRLALVWSCQVHTAVSKLEPGRCPQCGRDLVRMTRALSFTCPVHRKVDVLDPGRCPVCPRTLVAKYTIRPHGDHNPKHGGNFFMVSNNWHIEATHPALSVFRLYVYDDYSKPFTPPGLTARIVEVPDAVGKPRNVSVPFSRAPRGVYMEARIPGLSVPANIAAKARFEAGDKEYRFDFIFTEYSREPGSSPPRRTGTRGTK
jgi:Heavy metal binding domain